MYKYVFAPYSGVGSKITCPSCGKKHKLTRYIDTKTNELLDESYGVCDRSSNCGYHKSPYHNPPSENSTYVGKKVIPKPDDGKHDVLPHSLLKKSLANQFRDNFSGFIIKKFGRRGIQALERYNVGYSSAFGGQSTIFWQISFDNEVRGGKIFKYGLNGKREKSEYPKITWVHSFLKRPFKLRQVFFGSHLLKKYPDKKVVVLESEKSAIILSIINNGVIWLAATQLGGLAAHKFECLKDREIILMPDKGKAYLIWKEKAEKLQKTLQLSIKTSTFVEDSEELVDGDDIADLYT